MDLSKQIFYFPHILSQWHFGHHSNLLANMSVDSLSNVQITEALRLQMEVQQKLRDQLEVNIMLPILSIIKSNFQMHNLVS